jgi:hypothetical protein
MPRRSLSSGAHSRDPLAGHDGYRLGLLLLLVVLLLAADGLEHGEVASTLRSSRSFSLGSNSGSFFVVTRYGARELHKERDCACQATSGTRY